MKQPLKILLLEDNPEDADLIKRCLLKERKLLDFRHAVNRESYLQMLEEFQPDLILSDHGLPQFNSSEALVIARRQFPDIPFIMITGTISEEFAAEITKAGADDYILKDRISRLPLAIDHALNHRKIEKEKREALQKLIQSEEKYRAIMERVSDAFVAIDNHWCFTYVNKEAGEILDRKPSELIGKIVWEEFPEGTNQPFYSALFRSMKTQEYFHAEEYYPPLDIWIESHIYPSPDGLSVFFRNITERKESEQRITQSELNLKAIFENTSEGFILTDTEAVVKAFNNTARESILFNSEKEVKAGRSLYDFVEDPGIDFFKEMVSRAIDGEILQYEHAFHRTDGRVTWMNFAFNPVRENNIITGICITSRDISKQKIAEEEIRKTNERFELVVSATNDVIWDWDLLTDKIWWNKNYYSHFGYERESTKPYKFTWSNCVYPDDKDRVLKGIQSGIERKDLFWTDEYRFLKADKTIAYVLDCGYILYSPEGEAYRMVGAMLDITDRKKAESLLQESFSEKKSLAERMSVILNTLPANIALLDEKGFIIDINDSWKEFNEQNGLAGKQYGIGDNYIRVIQKTFGDDKPGRKAVVQGITHVLEGKIAEFVYEYPGESPLAKKWYRMVATPLEGKEYTGAVVMHIDISELRRLEQERVESKTEEQKNITRAMLQAQENERNAIGLELHDNVNQILAVAIMQLSMIKNNPEKIRHYIDSSMKHLQDAVEENRKIAHALVIPDFAIKNLVDQLFTLTDNMLIVSGIHVHFDTQYFQQELLDDPQKLTVYRIAQEQCSNILKYSKARSVNLVLRTSAGLFKMTIADDGQGMGPARKTKGIGLRNIKDRLGILNGTVTVSSAPGKGFTLEITIPVQK